MTLATELSQQTSLDPRTRNAFIELIENCFGIRLSARQVAEFDRHVLALAARSGATDPALLHQSLRNGARPDLLNDLVTTCTIGETHFFRIPPQIELLRRH